jgi:hypothetical protein
MDKRASTGDEYEFKGGYPTPETVQRVYDEADLNRVIEAYRFFYPTVSGAAIIKGNAAVGVVENQVFGVLDTKPRHIGFTLNSDTPYGSALLNLHQGPMTVELPPGPLIAAAVDVNQRWIADMGLPGPDAGKGGKHAILPPDYKGDVPSGYHVWKSSTYRVILAVRSLPLEGDVKAAVDRIPTVKLHPLNQPGDWKDPTWVNLTEEPLDITPLKWETNLTFWEVLHEVVDTKPPYDGYRDSYGELAALGIVKGRPFAPDARMKHILERAAQMGHAQMRVQSFADRRPDRVVWRDRTWEWAALRFEDGDLDAATYVDLDAREKWFFQAIAASPEMFRRQVGAGSLYWLGLREKGGKYLILPPAHKETVPTGYIPLASDTYEGYALLRSIPKSGSEPDVARAVAYGKRVKLYPLSQSAKPPATTFVDVVDVVYDSTIPYNLRFFESLNRIVQAEPWLERDKAMIDQLKSIGIEKGKPFNPDPRTQDILNNAAREAHAWLVARYEAFFSSSYYEGSHWALPGSLELLEGIATFFAKPDVYPVDLRGLAYSYAYFSPKHLDASAGSFYLLTIADKDGRLLDGGTTYHLTVPANAPVRQYWSATVYDRTTHAPIRNARWPSRSSHTPGLQKHADGSVDIYFGPKAPVGKESNWVPTSADGGFEVLFRFYGPEKPLFDKTWKLPDIEEVK